MRSLTSFRPNLLVREKFFGLSSARFFLAALTSLCLVASLYFAPALLSRRQTPLRPSAATLPTSSASTGEHGVDVQAATGGTVKASTAGVAEARAREAYGQLPIAFEENAGQYDGKVKYSARGSGYQLFLTPDEAVLALNKPATDARREPEPQPEPQAEREAAKLSRASESGAVLRLKLVGANGRARVKGEAGLAAKSNYFVGAKAKSWHTGVAMFEKVRYAEVYPGIDVVYYGNQRQLEYDFIVAPHVDPARIKFKFSGAQELHLDAEGHLLLQTGGGYVRQEKPVLYQLVNGTRQEVAGRYEIDESGEIGFQVGQYDRSRPLVIDPVLAYSTYLGGTGTDQALAIALDAQGNTYVTGHTASFDFPTVKPFQAAKGEDSDVFVLKLNPGGNALVYATYLGGNSVDRGQGIAVDSSGNAYITGQTFSNDFPITFGTVQDNSAGSADGFVTKLNADGSGLSYSSYLGGESFDEGFGIAVDAAGNAYVTGSTDSSSFLDGLEMPKQGSPIYKSSDAGGSWSPRKNTLPEPNVASITVDPTNPNILYAAAPSGVYKSFDGGGNWNVTGLGSSVTPFSAKAVVVDPSTPTTLYAATFAGAYKSTNGGDIWNYSSTGMEGIASFVFSLTIDPTSTSTLYAATFGGVYQSTNGGASWAKKSTGIPLNVNQINKIVLDPTNSNVLYAATNFGIYKSVNRAASWSVINNGLVSTSGGTPSVSSLAISPASPATVYAGTSIGVFKSTDGGLNWVASNDGMRVLTTNGNPYIPPTTAIVISPAQPTTIYASSSQGGVFKSTDGGANWTASNNGLGNIYVLDLAIDPTSAATLYAAAYSFSDGFVIKLNPTGTDVGYLRYLGGNEQDEGRSIAVDAGGNAYLTGETFSTNFQTLNPLQINSGGGVLSEAFVAKLSSDGSTVYATYLGGNGSDVGFGIAVNAAGNAHVTGTTTSTNFPTAGTRPTSNTFGAEVFVSKLDVSGTSLDYSIYHGGHATEQGNSIALDAAGNAYVTGSTTSSDFPRFNGVQAAWGGGTDAFVLKLSPMSNVIYSTYVGGAGNDQGFGIATDNSGTAYIAGSTTSSNFPTVAPFQQFQRGGGDGFVAKISTSVDLAVTITDAPDPVVLGEELTYTIKVANVGELTATGVRLTDTLPAGSVFVSATATTGACSGNGAVICDLGTFAGGASATVTIVVRAPGVRNISNTATVTANETEVNTSNNTATQETVVNFADLSMTAGVLQGLVAKGGRLTYVLGISNNGGTTAGNVKINLTLPFGLTLVSCTNPGGACIGVGNDLTVTLPTLAVNATQSVIIVAEVGSNVADNATFSIIATASSSLPDPNPANNSAAASASVSSNVVQPKSNGKIAFTLLFDGVYTMNADGTNIRKIYSLTDGRYSLATWSPDGTKIAFIYEPPGNGFTTFEVRIVNADGSGARLLSTNATLDSRPTWSPSGEFVGFVSRDRESFQIVSANQVADPNGTPIATTLFNTNSILEEVSWSPDGAKLLYNNATGELWTVNIDGSSPKLLDSDPNTSDRVPVWSHDGTKILFLRHFNNNNSDAVDIYTMNADGTDAKPLPNPISSTSSSLRRPVFSPDGTQIAYQFPVSINGSSFYEFGILKANADGTNITRVPLDGQAGNAPSWQALPSSNPPPTPVPTFKISGHVTPPSGQSSLIAGFVQLNLTGTRTATAFPDSNGNYSFTLPAGGNYTITPVVSHYYNFSPGGYTFNNLSADQPNANFTTTRIIYSISGRVADPSGAPLSNVEVTLSSMGALVGTIRTGQDGTYLFDDLRYDSIYTVLVPLSSRTSYEFEPDARVLNLRQSEIVNFVGTPKNSFLFASDPAVVGEGAGHATVVVARAGTPATLALPASVTVQTYDDPASASVPCDPTLKRPDGTAYPTGQAYARCDYATTVQTLTFAPGETQKIVNIPIIDDVHVEGTEVVPVRLSNPVGATLELIRSGMHVVIHDNDSGTAQNPTRTTAFFVRMHYLDFLSREPEPNEPWSAILNNCPNAFNLDAQSPSAACDRLIVSQSFFGAPEFRLKGLFVYNFYRVAFNRRPEYAEIIPDMSALSGATAAEVYARRAALPVSFTARPEFKTRFDALSDTAFVAALLDRYGLQQITTPDPQQPEASARVVLTRAELINRLSASGAQALTRAQVLRAVVESSEVGAAEYNGAFVAMQYYGYLRRTPEESGYQAWLKVINEDPNNIRIMVNGFVNSTEYRLRFGQP